MSLPQEVYAVTGGCARKKSENAIVSRQQKWHRLRDLVRGRLQVFSCMQENT
jgi:hypothetical protein